MVSMLIITHRLPKSARFEFPQFLNLFNKAARVHSLAAAFRRGLEPMSCRK
jgi:hypothetical protein